MSKKYGDLVSEINGILEIYCKEENKYSVYLKVRSETGRMSKKLLQTDFKTVDDAMAYCRKMINLAAQHM